MSIYISLKKQYRGFHLNVEFDSRNQRLGILGASGSGKSITLKCIAGVIKPDSGRIEVNGRVLFDSEKNINLSPQERRVGYLFQNYALFPTMTVEENIGAGIKEPKQLRKQKIAEKIREFRLEGLEKRYPGEISGGQQQRVALARMLASNPEIILLDEPFSALDSFLKEILQQQLLNTLKAYSGDIILVSHSRDEVYRFCERLMVIDQGKTIITGDTKGLFHNPVKAEVARLTGCKNISAISRIDEHTLEALQWGIRIRVNQVIGDRVRYVGIRAHDLVPVWDKAEGNYIPFILAGSSSLPFEEHFFLQPVNETAADEPICYFVQKDRMKELEEKGLPKYLHLPEEKLLFLE